MDRSAKQTNPEIAEGHCGADKYDNPIGANRSLLCVLFLVFCLILAYIINFHSHAISSDPGDWGALGDYLGGITNPLISAIALIYLAKAYYTQKAELAETRSALRDTAKHSEDSARAQAKLVDAATRQEILTKKNLELKFLATQINLHQSRISFLHNEISNSTYNFNKFTSTIDIFSIREESWLTDRNKMDSYRFKLLSLISKEDIEMINLAARVKELLNSEACPEQD
ncbi:hypothetical protein [Pseudomonas viridiflava]|uniref:hypothetical protein n=1 Tax=Pseudomonas viridiflava TaxID=33069 RepID=UPI001C2D475F|nr:hypothetical protein [Pseudomonas viridiflava]MBV1807494.1 hypothetical protein [Pseudomonas viridiflava]